MNHIETNANTVFDIPPRSFRQRYSPRLEHALAFYDIEPDHEPPKSLCIGPDTAGNLIEMLYLRFVDDDVIIDVIIHAMPLRKTFRTDLTGGSP